MRVSRRVSVLLAATAQCRWLTSLESQNPSDSCPASKPAEGPVTEICARRCTDQGRCTANKLQLEGARIETVLNLSQ